MRVIAALSLSMALLCGCAPDASREFKQVSEVTSPNQRLSVVDGPLKIGFNNIWIIRDSQTGSEFIFIGGSDRVAVCPVPQQERIPRDENH